MSQWTSLGAKQPLQTFPACLSVRPTGSLRGAAIAPRSTCRNKADKKNI